MPSKGTFHPQALEEYAEAARYYLEEASVSVAGSFASAIESAVASVVTNPQAWRVVEEPGIRRYVVRRFPFVIYYRWEPVSDRGMIYAIMHCSRRPGYWVRRLEPDA